MKNKMAVASGALFVFLLAFQGAGLAKTFQGTVMSVSPGQNQLQIQAQEPGAEQPQEFNVSVSEDVEMQGFQSLNELNAGDEIRVEGQSAGGNNIEADLISRQSPGQAEQEGGGLFGG